MGQIRDAAEVAMWSAAEVGGVVEAARLIATNVVPL